MKYTDIAPYNRGQRPQFKESEREYVDQELKKLEAVVRTLKAAIEELRPTK